MLYILVVSDYQGKINDFDDEELEYEDASEAVAKAYDIIRNNPTFSVDVFALMGHYERIRDASWQNN